jgi:hypothetical protein
MMMNGSNIFQIIIPFFWDIIKLLILPILVLIFGNYIKNNKPGNKWLVFLTSKNTKIDDCLNNYEKIKYSSSYGLRFFSFIIGGFLTIYIYDHYYFNPDNIIISLLMMGGIIDQIIVVFIFFIGLYINYISKNNKLLEKSNSIESYFEIALSFFYGSSFIIIILSVIIVLMIPNGIPNGISNGISNILRFGINLMYLIIIIIMVIILKILFRNLFLNRLKNESWLKYKKDFPYVNISTIGGNVYGKIDFIFDDEMITLDNEGTNISIGWKNIIFIELFKPP